MIVETIIKISEKQMGGKVEESGSLVIEFDDVMPSGNESQYAKIRLQEKNFYLEKKDLLTLGNLIISSLASHEGLDMEDFE